MITINQFIVFYNQPLVKGKGYHHVSW